ncbi:MAG: DUF1272 domain-containing protein [Proteobacteria bacterium]|nr:DUF1272 domain-containing protein [Pseudomonadota bacterium]MBP6105713.1 DUF1272 domain-containing protein [Steroidobacteraceae bacterium]MBP7013926.1 DUF1272 domain-containing protein [Steroidobacteraceae bacterium]
MLDIRPSCECCDADLPPESPLARICSFECTFCATCAERRLNGKSPTCGGELLPRPRRPASKLEAYPPSSVRVCKPAGSRTVPVVGGPTRSSRTVVVRRVAATETSLLEPPGDLLIDAVHSGAAIGFLAPLSRETAGRYWHGVFASLPGWSRAGEIPEYATTPDGELFPAVLYFKQLRA